MCHTHTHTQVLSAVDSEIGALEERLATLHEIRRLALELDQPEQLRAAATAPERKLGKPAKRLAPSLTPADVQDVARGLLADGPVTVNRILKQLGRSHTARSTAAVQEALEQLGAVQAGPARGGGTAYALPAGQDGLADAIAELNETAVGWTDEEFQYQLRKRHHITASVADVHRTLAELNGAHA